MNIQTSEQAGGQLGDMTIVGSWPAKALKALAVIADTLHQSYDAHPGAPAGWSKNTCLFSSLAVRDFLVAIGLTDATVRTCAVLIKATEKKIENGKATIGNEIWSVGVGVPNQNDLPDKFNGHAVVVIPSLQLLIDTTLYPSIRKQWSGALTGMFATGYSTPGDTAFYGRYPFSGAELEMPDRFFNIVWLDRPEINWKREIDYRVKTTRRRDVTRAMIERFGKWQNTP